MTEDEDDFLLPNDFYFFLLLPNDFLLPIHDRRSHTKTKSKTIFVARCPLMTDHEDEDYFR